MTISTKDQKILWGKAAARCSMTGCRKLLVPDDSLIGEALIGENCHIVAATNTPAAPRGSSPLTTSERNSYPNLILLCPNHHKSIDKSPEAWPIEKLHQIKSDHEMWVETQLTNNVEDIASEIYSDIVNTITEGLLLSNWDGVSDRLVNFAMLKRFFIGSNVFWEKCQKVVWPGKYPELEDAIKNLCNRNSQYVEHFINNSELAGDGDYVENKDWKRVWSKNYDYYSQQSKKWQKESTDLLFNLIVALNEYANSVRKFLNPKYFLYEGQFCVYDSLGVLNSLNPGIVIPNKYI